MVYKINKVDNSNLKERDWDNYSLKKILKLVDKQHGDLFLKPTVLQGGHP